MADLLWIQESSPIAVFRDGNYPVLRGTFIDLNGKGLLYTRGSVPYYGTYPGLRVPRPLLLVPHDNTDSAILTLAKDVLALTKVNWNTTQFDQKLPAPIKAARGLGVFSNTSSSEQRCLRISGSTRDPRCRPRGPAAYTTPFNPFLATSARSFREATPGCITRRPAGSRRRRRYATRHPLRSAGSGV